MRQHGVDLAGFRGEIGPGERPVAVVAADFSDQPLELLDIAVDRLLELRLAPIFPADLVEGLLALHRVEPPREHVALPTPVSIPELDCGIVVDHPGNVARDGVEGAQAVARRAFRPARGLRRCGVILRSPGQEVGEPAALLAIVARLRRRSLAPRGGAGRGLGGGLDAARCRSRGRGFGCLRQRHRRLRRPKLRREGG